jgi:oligopeptide transport system ATP-binding protein
VSVPIKAEIVLDVRNLKTYFFTAEGVVKAVDGLSYSVRKGECVGLVGESGCGKSVSSMSILRIVSFPPGLIVDGKVLFKDKDLLRISEDEMRNIRGNQISMIFQDATTSLNPVIRVGSQISETLMLHHNMKKADAVKESIRLLKTVGIPDPEKRIRQYPYEFSGGMQQRIMIAIALACNPSLIIADEPTTALDVTIQAQVLEILDKLRREFGTSVILITHNLGIVARYVDRVNVMYAGSIVESGMTDDIYLSPKHPYTKALLASVPRLDRPKDQDLKAIRGSPPNLLSLPPGCPYAPRCDYTIDRCQKEKPVLKPSGKDHLCACHMAVNENNGDIS